jgi:outer membrane protein OmpA-like peptidoglycan-associated protein
MQNTHIREGKTDFGGKMIWEEYKNEGFHLVVDKENFDKKLVPLEFGNTKSGDTIFLTIPLKNLRPEIMVASNYSEPTSTLQFKNIRIVHSSGGSNQVFLSMDMGIFAYKQTKGSSVLDNDKEILPFAEGLSEEENLLISLYNVLAQKNLLALDTIDLENLYYGFDKFNLNTKSVADLDKIIEVMKLHPDIQVELKAYTDNRGPANYNMVLAKRRVLSAFQYLIKQGISRTRIIQTPVGEAEYIKDCNTTPCSEDDHKLNRRTEMLIRYEVEMLGSN